MILSEYDPRWKLAFGELEKVYRNVLGELIVAIEHVGSTAIGGIAAKPILDIDLVINDCSVFQEVIKKLQFLGYRYAGDQGIPQREAFHREDENVPWYEDCRSWMNHHLYVCPDDSRELSRQIVFRDFLSSHEEERNKYEEIKKEIESRSNGDRKTYAKIKEQEGPCRDFVESILLKAEQVKGGGGEQTTAP